MRPRLQPTSKAIRSILRIRSPTTRQHRQYAVAATAVATSASADHAMPPITAKPRYPKTQPPSLKPPELRKTQLLRQYTSLLHSTPLMLLFQHNSMLASEWIGIRRELIKAFRKVDAKRALAGSLDTSLTDGMKLQVIQTGIFAAALRIVEFYKPEATPAADGFTHSLSKSAHEAVVLKKSKHALAPLLSGPLALLTFPVVDPEYLKAALIVLAPNAPLFPPPTRRDSPGWHEMSVQAGLRKLLLLGARVEGRVFDVDRTRWVGGIDGGLDGLRGQLVAMLQSVGGGLTSTLESAARNLYFTVDGRRMMLEDEAKGPEEASQDTPKAE